MEPQALDAKKEKQASWTSFPLTRTEISLGLKTKPRQCLR